MVLSKKPRTLSIGRKRANTVKRKPEPDSAPTPQDADDDASVLSPEFTTKLVKHFHQAKKAALRKN